MGVLEAMEPGAKSKIQRLLGAKAQGSQIVLGLSGGSGSGKSTIAKAVASRLSHLEIERICLDRFFFPVDELPRYYSHYLGREQPNFNRPDSLDFDRMIDFCQNISGFDLVILEGHFALYRQEMREMMDIKCFVTIDVQEMLERRTRRNLAAHYGGDEDNILHYNQECVLPMYNKYILGTSRYADLLIPNSSGDVEARDALVEGLCREIRVALARTSPVLVDEEGVR